MGNPVVQFQILSKAPEETARFYSKLFGWKVSADNPLGYREISTGSRDGIQGGIWPAPPQAANFVQLFVEVESVRAFCDRAEAEGAKVIIPYTILPDGAEMAVLHDPHGMAFGIVKKAEADMKSLHTPAGRR
jgi:uncharacterized protein